MRLLGVVLAIVVIVTGWSSAASASPAQVARFRMRGPMVQAIWLTITPRRVTNSAVFVIQGTDGRLLYAIQSVETFDAAGNPTGSSDLYALTTRGYSFSLDPSLRAARFVANGTPGYRCRFDAIGLLLGCAPARVSAEVAWRAVGKLGVDRELERLDWPGFHAINVEVDRSRTAVATGTFEGTPLTEASLTAAGEPGLLASVTSGSVGITLPS
jgi:hypothetical protein